MITPIIIGVNANMTDIFIVAKPDQTLNDYEAIDVAAELLATVFIIRDGRRDPIFTGSPDLLEKVMAEVEHKVNEKLDM